MKQDTIKKYGQSPFNIAVLHGGPGALGYMAPVAKELSVDYGVLEPFQSKLNVQGQIDELKDQIHDCSPITLIGSSWGAMLALLFAAQNQDVVKKLILVGCGTSTKKHSQKVKSTRDKRFTEEQRLKLNDLLGEIDSVSISEQNKMTGSFGKLFDKSDHYELLENNAYNGLNWQAFKSVWSDFVKLRDREGYIESQFSKIKLPVTLIQGDYDPHPAKEIYEFLKSVIPQTKMHVLRKCGHYPWLEKYAKFEFYKILKKELA